MAQKVQILLLDDLDGTDAEETVEFGLDGHKYEIDLNGKNSEKLRKALAPFIDAGRRTQARRGRKPGTAAATATAAAPRARKRTSTVEDIEAGKAK